MNTFSSHSNYNFAHVFDFCLKQFSKNYQFKIIDVFLWYEY